MTTAGMPLGAVRVDQPLPYGGDSHLGKGRAVPACWVDYERRNRRATTAYLVEGKGVVETVVPVLRKFCGGCREWLPFQWFGRDRARRDGRHYRCRACRSEAS